MTRKTPKDNSGKRVIALFSVIGVLVLVLIIAGIWESRNASKQDQQAYEWGYAIPIQVSRDLAEIDFEARRECYKAGLTEEECPRANRETLRRVMATLMTQAIEQREIGWEGYAYKPDTIRAMNYRFYETILRLEEAGCLPLIGNHSAKVLGYLRDVRIIYPCTGGYSLTADWLEALEEASPASGGEDRQPFVSYGDPWGEELRTEAPYTEPPTSTPYVPPPTATPRE